MPWGRIVSHGVQAVKYDEQQLCDSTLSTGDTGGPGGLRIGRKYMVGLLSA